MESALIQKGKETISCSISTVLAKIKHPHTFEVQNTNRAVLVILRISSILMFLFACLFTVRVKRKVYLKREKQKGELEKIKTQDKEKSPPPFLREYSYFYLKLASHMTMNRKIHAHNLKIFNSPLFSTAYSKSEKTMTNQETEKGKSFNV